LRAVRRKWPRFCLYLRFKNRKTPFSCARALPGKQGSMSALAGEFRLAAVGCLGFGCEDAEAEVAELAQEERTGYWRIKLKH